MNQPAKAKLCKHMGTLLLKCDALTQAASISMHSLRCPAQTSCKCTPRLTVPPSASVDGTETGENEGDPTLSPLAASWLAQRDSSLTASKFWNRSSPTSSRSTSSSRDSSSLQSSRKGLWVVLHAALQAQNKEAGVASGHKIALSMAQYHQASIGPVQSGRCRPAPPCLPACQVCLHGAALN